VIPNRANDGTGRVSARFLNQRVPYRPFFDL
jgi:hypothetical protein